VKDVIEAHPDAGIACSFKNAGKGVGVPDVGRAKFEGAERRRSHLHQRGLHGQGLATVLLQIVAEATGLAGLGNQRA